MIVVHRKKRRQ